MSAEENYVRAQTEAYARELQYKLATEETARFLASKATERTALRTKLLYDLAKELWCIPVVFLLAGAALTFLLYLRYSIVQAEIVAAQSAEKIAAQLPVQIAACANACVKQGTSMHEYANNVCECK